MAQPTLPTPRPRRLNWVPYALIAPPLVVMGLLIIYPASLSIWDTVTVVDDGGAVRLSLEKYYNFFDAPRSWPNLVFTLQLTIVTVTALFVVCFPIAYYLRFADTRLVGPVQFLALFPLFVPGIITAYALLRFMGANGWLENILVSLFGWEGYVTPFPKATGIGIGLVWEGIPITILILTAGFAQIPDSLIESARDVGANRWQVFTRVILPLVRRPVLIVLTLNFLGVFGAFTMPYLLGPASPQMYGVYMQQLYGNTRYSNVQVAAVLMFLISSLVGLLYVRAIVSQRLEEGI